MAFEDIQLDEVKKTGISEPTLPGAINPEPVQANEPVQVEQPENVQDNVQSEAPVEAQGEAKVPQGNAFDIKEKTGGKYESFDDLWESYNKLQSQPKKEPISLKDEYIKGLVEYYEKTGDIKPYVDAMSKNYDEMSAEAIIRENMRSEYPNLSDAQFEKLFQKQLKSKYNLDTDEYDEDEIELAKALLENDATKIRNEFKERQSKFAAPEAEPQPDLSEQYEKWKEVVSQDSFVKQIQKEPKFKVKYGDNEFNIEVENSKDLVEAAYNDQKIFKNFVTGTGENAKIDFEKFVKTYHYSQNPEDFEKKLIDFGRTLGQNKVLDDLQNPTKIDNVNKPTRGEVTGDWKEEFFQAAKQTLKK